MFSDLGMKLEGLIKLYCDNKLAISIAHNPIHYDRTKHMEINQHFIKEKLESVCWPIKCRSQIHINDSRYMSYT